MHQKLVPDPFLLLVNNPKQSLKEDYQKAFKKVNFIFSFEPCLFNGQNHQKQKGPGSRGQLLFSLRNKFKKIPSLVMYYLIEFDDVI